MVNNLKTDRKLRVQLSPYLLNRFKIDHNLVNGEIYNRSCSILMFGSAVSSDSACTLQIKLSVPVTKIHNGDVL